MEKISEKIVQNDGFAASLERWGSRVDFADQSVLATAKHAQFRSALVWLRVYCLCRLFDHMGSVAVYGDEDVD